MRARPRYRLTMLACALTLAGTAPGAAQDSPRGALQDLLASLAHGGRPVLIDAGDVDGEALTPLIVNRLRFGLRTELGGTRPGISPELRGFFQNLDLSGGFYAAGGPFVSIPLGGRVAPFAARFGADVFTARLGAERITNQFAPGVLPVSGSWRQYGVIPYAGLSWIAPIGLPGLELFADVGYGFARHAVDLRTAVPIVEGRDTTGVFRTRFGFEFPVAPTIRIGASASYLRSANNDFRVLPGGPVASFGRNDQWAFTASLSTDLVWRNEQSQRLVWFAEPAGRPPR